MTVPTSTAKSGPYAGAGTAGPFTVGFRFLENSHLSVIRTSAIGVDSTLTLTSDYTVSGAGGSSGAVTLVAALAVGEKLTVIRNVPFTQDADYVQNDAFPAESHERALDKLTMQTQQLLEEVGRALTLPATAASVSTQLPSPQANNVIGWNESGSGLANLDAGKFATIVAYGTAKSDIFTGDGVTTAFELTVEPGSLNNLDVAIGGVTQLPGVDYFWTSGTVVTFTTAPVFGVKMLIRYMQGLPFGTSDASDVRFLQAGSGTVARTTQDKMRENVSVKDFGAVGDGVADDTEAFNLAAATATSVRVPKGIWKITAPTTGSAVWVLDAGAVIIGLPDLNDGQVPTANINNTSRLTGRIVRYQNTENGAGILVGDPDPWMEQYIRPSSLSRAEFSAVSPYGQIAITGASKTSDNPATFGTDMACIGGNFYAINDRGQQPGEILTAYAIYAEARRRPGGGAAYGMEVDIANEDAVVPCTPNSPLSYAEYNGGIIINSGSGLNPTDLNSASFGVLFGSNGDNFLRGIVFNDGSVDASTLEAIAMPLFYKFAWYESNVPVSYLDNREHSRKINTNISSIGVEDNNIRARASYGNTGSLDAIYKNTSYGWSGGAPYLGVFTRVLQRSDFSAGNARFSYDIEARNANGTSSQVTLNGAGDNTFSPSSSDNFINLGGPSFRWSVVYAGTGVINTSDEREKQDITELSSAEKRVGVALRGLVRKFRFKDAVAIKGSSARIHVGVIAQQVKAAFEAEGLDPFIYGVLCFDQWDEQAAVTHEDGNTVQASRAAGNRYGIRYDELLAFIISAL